MQGPINREPEDKLDPSQKQQQQNQTGIRRLYVVDSNNLIVVVIDSYFIISSYITTTTIKNNDSSSSLTPSSSSSLSKPLQLSTTITTSPLVDSCKALNANNDDNSNEENDDVIKRIDSSKLCLCILLFNIYYFMFICFNVACLPKLLLASLVYFLKDKPSVFLFISSLVFLFNDTCAKFIRPKLGKSNRRRSYFRFRTTPTLINMTASKRARLKDSLE